MFVASWGRITGSNSTSSSAPSTSLMARFITQILLHIRVTAVNLSCLRALRLLAAGECQGVIDSEPRQGGEASSANAKKNAQRKNTSTRFCLFLLPDRCRRLRHFWALPTGGRIFLHPAQTYACKINVYISINLRFITMQRISRRAGCFSCSGRGEMRRLD